MSKKYNFSVKLRPPNQKGKRSRRPQRRLSAEEENSILVKRFLRKWKQSGILRELKNREYPRTRGMKAREKRFMGKKRARKNLKKINSN
tara:strand:+ start:310 stop:576 length:267 start_codon:yes stop_codon:yes gene_type:complete